MEPKRQTVSDKLAEFKARYPREKFIWVNAPLETSGDWPEHYGLGARCFKVPTDNIVSYTNQRTGKTSRQNGWIYELNGLWALSKPSKLQIMHDAGVIFSREKLRRIDDGSDPDVCEMEGAAAILTLSGLQTVSGRKRIDRKVGKRPPDPEFLIENCETKLELRLGWKLVGLPQAFTMGELQAKEFVTFCIFCAPHATNPAERMLVLQHALGVWGPAYGSPVHTLPAGECEPQRLIEAPTQQPVRTGEEVQGAAEIEVIEERDEDDTEPDNETAAPGPAPEPDYDFLKAVGGLKGMLQRLLGDDGIRQYYAVLATGGYEHANQIASREHKKAIYRELEKIVREAKAKQAPAPKQPEAPPVEQGPSSDHLSATPAPAAPAHPLQDFIDMRRASFERMAEDRLAKEIDQMGEDYPTVTDPAGLIAAYQAAKSKADLVDVATRLFIWTLDEAKRIREQHNATRGGER